MDSSPAASIAAICADCDSTCNTLFPISVDVLCIVFRRSLRTSRSFMAVLPSYPSLNFYQTRKTLAQNCIVQRHLSVNSQVIVNNELSLFLLSVPLLLIGPLSLNVSTVGSIHSQGTSVGVQRNMREAIASGYLRIVEFRIHAARLYLTLY